MATLGELLRRFRFHSVPGAATAVGVPADRVGELEAEVAPVFFALEEAQRHATDIVVAAARDAAARRAGAIEHSHRIVANARAGCAAARAEVAEEHLVDANRERERLLADGRAEADRIARVAAERMPALIQDVVQRVLAQAEALPALDPAERTERIVGPSGESGS